MNNTLKLLLLLCLWAGTAQAQINCLYVASDSLYWEAGQWQYDITFRNPLTSGFTVGYLEIREIPAPSGTITPGSITLTSGIAPGTNYSHTFTITDNAFAQTDSICYLVTAHDGPDEFFCCTTLDTICVGRPTPDLCALEVQLTTHSFCCHTLALNGTLPSGSIDFIETTLLEPAARFDQIPSIAPGWVYDVVVPQRSLRWRPLSGSAPADSLSLFDFCFSEELAEPVPLAVAWGDAAGTVCRDTVYPDCVDCFRITNDTVYCAPDGTYFYEFDLLNGSEYIVNAVELLDTTGQTVWRSGSLPILEIVPGETATDVVIPIDRPAGDYCFVLVLRQQFTLDLSVKCCSRELCLSLPACTDLCCGTLDSALWDVAQGFNAQYVCSQQQMTCTPLATGPCDQLNWEITFPNSPTTLGGVTYGGTPLTFSLTENGTYTICMELFRFAEEGGLCFPDDSLVYCATIEVDCPLLGCFDPTLVDFGTDCGQFANPVCGCDDMDYINPCAAAEINGITEWSPGPCSALTFGPILLEAEGQGDDAIAVDWQVLQFFELDYFALRRRQWIGSWTTIAYLPAVDGQIDYSYLDEQPLTGLNSYQVIAAQLGGKALFSTIDSAAPGFHDDDDELAPWTAPGHQFLYAKPTQKSHGHATLSDLYGRVLRQVSWQPPTDHIALSTAGLHPGWYILTLHSPAFGRRSARVLIQ